MVAAKAAQLFLAPLQLQHSLPSMLPSEPAASAGQEELWGFQEGVGEALLPTLLEPGPNENKPICANCTH